MFTQRDVHHNRKQAHPTVQRAGCLQMHRLQRQQRKDTCQEAKKINELRMAYHRGLTTHHSTVPSNSEQSTGGWRRRLQFQQ